MGRSHPSYYIDTKQFLIYKKDVKTSRELETLLDWIITLWKFSVRGLKSLGIKVLNHFLSLVTEACYRALGNSIIQ